MRTDIPERRAEIEAWIQERRSKAYICQQLDCKPSTLEFWLKRMNIQYAGNQAGVGRISRFRKHVSTYLKKGSMISTHQLKLKLLRDGIKEHRCENCLQTEWIAQPIPLELHHKDGDRHNNELDNLQLLCPNCHALTPNNSGKGTRKIAKRA